mmetsp:Transcript_10483/g.21530  ORF Transcript_10483/g.21530 Transcript_10483/m.21530 type:complete len:416 (+) Transcript_10483:1757-3004(+)
MASATAAPPPKKATSLPPWKRRIWTSTMTTNATTTNATTTGERHELASSAECLTMEECEGNYEEHRHPRRRTVVIGNCKCCTNRVPWRSWSCEISTAPVPPPTPPPSSVKKCIARSISFYSTNPRKPPNSDSNKVYPAPSPTGASPSHRRRESRSRPRNRRSWSFPKRPLRIRGTTTTRTTTPRRGDSPSSSPVPWPRRYSRCPVSDFFSFENDERERERERETANPKRRVDASSRRRRPLWKTTSFVPISFRWTSILLHEMWNGESIHSVHRPLRMTTFTTPILSRRRRNRIRSSTRKTITLAVIRMEAAVAAVPVALPPRHRQRHRHRRRTIRAPPSNPITPKARRIAVENRVLPRIFIKTLPCSGRVFPIKMPNRRLRKRTMPLPPRTLLVDCPPSRKCPMKTCPSRPCRRT